jgi:NAD(P)-dependent dehydrogenase (short-subunit alcohol dehydrogenase family)
LTPANGLFDLTGRVAVITGGAGLLGVQHAEAIAAAGGHPVLVDLRRESAESEAARIAKQWEVPSLALTADVTRPDEVGRIRNVVLQKLGRIDILINNAAIDPKAVEGGGIEGSRLESFTLDRWNTELGVGLTGAFLCSQVLGSEMARRGRGVIVNVASDLGVIAPDQRIYRRADRAEDHQPVKPVSYAVVKSGLLGLTRYLATYWAERGVRVNALSPGGVRTDQPDEFVVRLANLIPMGRMAAVDEYRGAILFLCSDASSYMTGANLIVDGGRTCW